MLKRRMSIQYQVIEQSKDGYCIKFGRSDSALCKFVKNSMLDANRNLPPNNFHDSYDLDCIVLKIEEVVSNMHNRWAWCHGQSLLMVLFPLNEARTDY